MSISIAFYLVALSTDEIRIAAKHFVHVMRHLLDRRCRIIECKGCMPYIFIIYSPHLRHVTFVNLTNHRRHMTYRIFHQSVVPLIAP